MPGILEQDVMVLTADIYKTATLLISEYGELAPAGACIKADQMSEQGNTTAKEMWLRIAQAAQDLLAEERPVGSVVH
jgi:hypothetical protein